MKRPPPLDQRRVELLATHRALFEGPDGASAPQILRLGGIAESSLRRMLAAGVQAGELFEAGGRNSRRYFWTEAAALAFSEPISTAHSASVKSALPRRVRTKGAPSTWRNTPAYSPPDVVLQICPSSKDTRLSVPADFRGPFSIAGIGRDVETGRPWGAV